MNLASSASDSAFDSVGDATSGDATMSVLTFLFAPCSGGRKSLSGMSSSCSVFQAPSVADNFGIELESHKRGQT